MQFGARVLKTGIAVTLSLYISSLFPQLGGTIFAAVAAIFAIQPTIYRSWRYILEQLQANAVGACIALTASFVFPHEPISMGLICIIVIMISLKFRMTESLGLTLVTVLAVMDAPGHWSFALNRFLLVLIGIACAFIVNIVFFPPNQQKRFVQQIRQAFDKCSLLLRTIISNEMKATVYAEYKEALEKSLRSLEEQYTLHEEEHRKIGQLKWKDYRELVVHKQLLVSMRKGADVLNVVEQHYYQTVHDKQMSRRFDEHLEQLTKYHEYVLLKYEQRIKDKAKHGFDPIAAGAAFLNEVIAYSAEHPDNGGTPVVVASAMYEYGYALHRLERIVGHRRFSKHGDDAEGKAKQASQQT